MPPHFTGERTPANNRKNELLRLGRPKIVEEINRLRVDHGYSAIAMHNFVGWSTTDLVDHLYQIENTMAGPGRFTPKGE